MKADNGFSSILVPLIPALYLAMPLESCEIGSALSMVEVVVAGKLLNIFACREPNSSARP